MSLIRLPMRFLERSRVKAFAPARARNKCSMNDAVKDTIDRIREHPELMARLLDQADADVRHSVLAATARSAFDEADSDGDGTIDRNEQMQFTRRYSPVCASSKSKFAGEAPDSTQLLRLAVRTAIPFVGFGYLDNAIMIVAGDSIDETFGCALGLSSMAAAGLGNLVSDVIGIQASSAIERGSDAAGLPDPKLTPTQMASTSARVTSMGASMLGIAIGCILGLSPLLVMEDEETRGLRKTFASIDENNNGTIEMGELEDVSVKAPAPPLPRSARSPADLLTGSRSQALYRSGLDFSREAVEKAFREIDSDRSKSISFDEFKALMLTWKINIKMP